MNEELAYSIHLGSDKNRTNKAKGMSKLVMFAMAKLMEMETTEQNKVALYLFNNIKT